MTNIVIAIVGKPRSGNTTLIKEFFKPLPVRFRHLTKKVVNGKLVYAYGASSSTERVDYQSLEAVKNDIEQRLSACKKDAKDKKFVLLLPLTLRRGYEVLVTSSIQWLKRQGYRVVVVYLRKMDFADLAMIEVSDKEIQSAWGDHKRHTKELTDIIKGL